jgi:hypothetical protein
MRQIGDSRNTQLKQIVGNRMKKIVNSLKNQIIIAGWPGFLIGKMI